MRSIFLLTVLVTVLNAKSFTVDLKYHESVMENLIKSNKLAEFLIERDLKRASVLANVQQPMQDYNDAFYTTLVSFGSPPQSLHLSLDTSTSTLWIIDKSCKSSQCTASNRGVKRTLFDPTASSTFKNISQSFKYDLFGPSDQMTGWMAYDDFTIGGGINVNQEFALAEYAPVDLQYEPMDGVFGLGWPYLAINNMLPAMFNLASQLDKPIFTIWLQKRNDTSLGDVGGQISYGTVDTTNCATQINYTPLSSAAYWQFAIQGFSIGTYMDSMKYQVLSDTSSNLIGGPTAAIQAIAKQIGGKYNPDFQQYIVPCSTVATLPDLIFNINGNKFNVPSSQYVMSNRGQNCLVNMFEISSSNGLQPAWIFGAPFIRTYCHVYDIANKQIGFARSNGV